MIATAYCKFHEQGKCFSPDAPTPGLSDCVGKEGCFSHGETKTPRNLDRHSIIALVTFLINHFEITTEDLRDTEEPMGDLLSTITHNCYGEN